MRRGLRTNMLIIIILASTLWACVTIEQQCSPGDQTSQKQKCPPNAYCSAEGYCRCNDGWILDCTTKAKQLTTKEQQYQISTGELALFFIRPSDAASVYLYKFDFCSNQPKDNRIYNLTLYFDDGTVDKAQNLKKIGHASILGNTKCWPLFSPYLKFDSQDNGDPEYLILAIGITYTNAAETNSSNSKQPIFTQKITLSVQQIVFLSMNAMWGFFFSFLSFSGLSLVVGLGYCCYMIRRRERFAYSTSTHNTNEINNLDHFEQYFPQFCAQDQTNLLSQACPICLLQYKRDDVLRITYCHHPFHAICLDQWCKVRLNCPVCRKSLSKEKAQEERNLRVIHSQEQIDEDEMLDQLQNPSKFDQSQDKIMKLKLIN